MGSSTGRFDVGTERLVTPPIQGRADELSVIGASVTAVAQGGGVCWSSWGAGWTTLRPKSLTGWFTSAAVWIEQHGDDPDVVHLAGGRLSAELPASVRLERSRRCRPELACR